MNTNTLTGKVKQHLSVFSLVAGLSAAACVTGCGADVPQEEEQGETDSALTNGNDRTAFRFFVGKGLTKIQSAAIVGNLDQESSMNPQARQLPSGPGRGIAQWSLNARWAQENTFARNAGKDPMALATQLDFVWHELTTTSSFGLASLRRATTIASAVRIVQDKYEVCGTCNVGRRVTFAQNALDSFGNETVTPAPAAESDDAPGDCIVDGVAGDCIATSACKASGGVSTSGLCPGANDIQCCTRP